jgi:signal transduction histidine kinase/CheY-like chemotaxis protein
LLGLAIFGTVAGASSIYRGFETGWLTVMTVHVIVVLALWTATLLRPLLPHKFKAWLIVLIMMLIPLSGLWTLGMIAAASVGLIVSPILGTILFGKREGKILAASTLLSVFVIAVYSVQTGRVPNIDLTDFLTSGISWAAYLFGAVFFIFGGVLTISYLNEMLLESLDASQKNEVALTKLTKEIATARDVETRANEAKSYFLANMSHEIRTPMNSIIGFTNLALQDGLSVSQQNFISKANNSAKQLLGILNDILDISKIEAGKLEFESVNFLLMDAVANLKNISGLRAKEKNIDLSVKIDPDVPKILTGDPLRLLQVLINLEQNAEKFSKPNDRVLLEVSVQEERDSEILLHFTVKDTGIGISPEQQELLFQSFNQADISTTRKYGGTGLGLAISKQIIERMHGDIWVESEIGTGSTFHFTALLGKPRGEIELINLSPRFNEGEVDQALAKLRGSRILLVEDNEINQEIVVEILTKQQISVSTVDNGQQALDILTHEEFDAVLLDCQMPVLDGYETACEIRKQEIYDNLPIIALTASIMKGDRKKALTSGMNDVISKPMDPEKLFITLAKWIVTHSG